MDTRFWIYLLTSFGIVSGAVGFVLYRAYSELKWQIEYLKFNDRVLRATIQLMKNIEVEKESYIDKDIDCD